MDKLFEMRGDVSQLFLLNRVVYRELRFEYWGSKNGIQQFKLDLIELIWMSSIEWPVDRFNLDQRTGFKSWISSSECDQLNRRKYIDSLSSRPFWKLPFNSNGDTASSSQSSPPIHTIRHLLIIPFFTHSNSTGLFKCLTRQFVKRSSKPSMTLN